jgi:hypothetical protein
MVEDAATIRMPDIDKGVEVVVEDHHPDALIRSQFRQ